MKAKVVARELLNRDLKIVPLFPKQKQHTSRLAK